MACGAPIEVELYPPMQGRACRFCLCLQGGSVFADFEIDPDGRVFGPHHARTRWKYARRMRSGLV